MISKSKIGPENHDPQISIIRPHTRTGDSPELHLAVFVNPLGAYDDEDEVVPLPGNVVDGPFQGCSAARREIHRDSDSSFGVHLFLSLSQSLCCAVL